MKKSYCAFFIFILVAPFSFICPNKIIKTTLNEEEQQLVESSQLLNDLFNIVYTSEKYYTKLSKEEIRKGAEDACRTLVHRDQHTSFLSKEEWKLLLDRMAGEFGGIGIALPGDKEVDEEFVPVIETVLAGPAEKAGLKMGDKILQIDNEIVRGMDITKVMLTLRGEKGSKVTVKIMRPNHADLIDITIVRDIIEDEISLSYQIEGHDIYYLLLSMFSEKSKEHVKQVLEVAYKKKSKGIIIDLRNNTGGLFDVASDIASLFLPKDSLVATTKNRNHQIIESLKTKSNPLANTHRVPIFFIVNNFTASSAEILAGSLRIYAEKFPEKENLSVFIVGTETWGKGSVQEVLPINGDYALKMTTALYFLPYDTAVECIGITPDFVIEPLLPLSDTMKWMQRQYGREKKLKKEEKPEEVSRNTKAKKDDTSWQKKRQESLAEDYVLQNTVNLIDLLAIGKSANPKMTNFKEQLTFLQKNFTTGKRLSLKELK